MQASEPLYRSVPRLIRKYYMLSEDGRTGSGLCLFDSREDAERLYDAAWRASIRERLGAEPTIEYFESPVIVDNDSGVISTAADLLAALEARGQADGRLAEGNAPTRSGRSPDRRVVGWRRGVGGVNGAGSVSLSLSCAGLARGLRVRSLPTQDSRLGPPRSARHNDPRWWRFEFGFRWAAL